MLLTYYTKLGIVFGAWEAEVNMKPIPAFLQLETISHDNDDRVEDAVLIEVYQAPNSRVSGTVVSDGWRNPRSEGQLQNGLGLTEELARLLLVAPWRRLCHEMFAADGNLVAWTAQDLRPWLARWFYRQQVSLIARAMEAHLSADRGLSCSVIDVRCG